MQTSQPGRRNFGLGRGPRSRSQIRFHSTLAGIVILETLFDGSLAQVQLTEPRSAVLAIFLVHSQVHLSILPARQNSARVSKDIEVHSFDDNREVLLRSWLLFGRRDPTAFPGTCNVPLDSGGQ
jgi:hypothetical protein